MRRLRGKLLVTDMNTVFDGEYANLVGSNEDKEPPALDARVMSATLYHVSTRGYAVIERFLDGPSIALLKSSMIAAMAKYKPRDGVPQSFNDQYQIHDLMITDENYPRLLDDLRLQRLLAAHLGDHWIMYAATSSSIPPKGKNYSSRIHVDSPRFHAGYVFNMGVIWALDDYTEDNGALEVLPGSHHSAETPDADLFDRASVKVLCSAGSLIIFNARLFHRTSTNNSSNWRHAMTMNACRSFMKPRMDWPRMIPDAMVNSLGAQAKRILGFDTRLPTSLDEFFVPESQRLYKSGQG